MRATLFTTEKEKMYKILQNAALIGLVSLATFSCSNLASNSTQEMAIAGTGLLLVLLLTGDALRALWRS
jgi:uncharacterized membrane protein